MRVATRLGLYARAHEIAWNPQGITPEVVRDFLINQHTQCPGRRTMVHALRCPLVGTPSRGKDCVSLCGTRLSASRVHVMVNALRKFFNLTSSTAAYDVSKQEGNPVVSAVVQDWEADVKKEQHAAEVIVKQAMPTFLFQLRMVMSVMDNQRQFGHLTPHQAWDVLASQCFLLATFFCTDRSFDLARCKGASLLQLSERAWLLNHFEGKTMRSSSRLATLLGHSDPLVDAVSRFAQLRGMAVAMDVTALTDTLLFRWFRGGTSLSQSPITTTMANAIVREWYTAAAIFDSHTIHGVRTGAGIEIALRGGSVKTVADYVGWSEETATHYLRLIDVLHLCNSTSLFEMEFSLGVTAEQHLQLNKLLSSQRSQQS